MSSSCLFCRIAAGDLPAYRVYEDGRIVAFLDLHPIREGHTLIVPRQHHRWFEDLPADLASEITHLAQRIARGLKALYRVDRVAMFYTGTHVPHVHAHVVPMHDVHDVTSQAYLSDEPGRFAVPPALPEADMARTAAQLRGSF
ncbi:HIT family protein [Defluviimonas sp. SAOS-178_SWC]|uniref:HIT family protein n=1 Tax=Defluviimonas sp. SAOS-178_SWC TaxID=3121287 RepID=UPI003221BBBD